MVVHDSRGRKVAETDAMGLTTNSEYDDLGRLTAVILPEVDVYEYGETEQTRLSPETNYEYDKYGNHIKTTDANGHVTHALRAF